jgi:hypothetical protein
MAKSQQMRWSRRGADLLPQLLVEDFDVFEHGCLRLLSAWMPPETAAVE